MGSGYFGQPVRMGNERSGGGGSSSSRKGGGHGKKSSSGNSSGSSNPEKPKQPQRGLGVAQLEKIRLHGQMAACNAYLPSLHPGHPSFSNPLQQQEEMRIQAAAAAAAGYGAMQGPPMHPPPYTYSPPQSSSTTYGCHPNMMMGMGMGDMERSNLRYAADNSQTPRWNPNYAVLDNQQPYMLQQDMTTRHLLNSFEGPMQRRAMNDVHEIAAGSSSQNSSDNDQDVDLELRL